MTLIVARCVKGRIAIAADTQLSEHGKTLPITASVLKTCCLPGYLCVAYSGSPELAAKAFQKFASRYPKGTCFEQVVSFFEASSLQDGNDFILGFGENPKIVTIRDGRGIRSLSHTHWIGDKDGFELFREYEHRQRKRPEQGRAVNAVIFADEMDGSPASDIYSAMRNVILDRRAPGVGGFVSVLSNRDVGFRYSVFSDVLFDWPNALPEYGEIKLTDNFDLVASGENDRFSISQISMGYYDSNVVAHYFLKGKLLFVLTGCFGGSPGRCVVLTGVEPQDIPRQLDEVLGMPSRAMCLIMSSRVEYPISSMAREAGMGVGLGLFCEANTMPVVETGRS